MSGIFDLKKGAFDSSEAARLHEAYAIALQGLRTSLPVDRPLVQRLSRSIVKVARSEPDCLKNDGTIDPVRLAQRAVLRMLQLNAPRVERTAEPTSRDRTRQAEPAAAPPEVAPRVPESAAKVMLKIFDGTRFAKL